MSVLVSILIVDDTKDVGTFFCPLLEINSIKSTELLPLRSSGRLGLTINILEIMYEKIWMGTVEETLLRVQE